MLLVYNHSLYTEPKITAVWRWVFEFKSNAVISLLVNSLKLKSYIGPCFQDQQHTSLALFIIPIIITTICKRILSFNILALSSLYFFSLQTLLWTSITLYISVFCTEREVHTDPMKWLFRACLLVTSMPVCGVFCYSKNYIPQYEQKKNNDSHDVCCSWAQHIHSLLNSPKNVTSPC